MQPPQETNDMTDTAHLNRFTSGSLVDKLVERNSTMSKADAKLAVARVFDAIDASLGNIDDQVRIAGFGTFKKKLQPGRVARNPRTGEELNIAEKPVVKFKQFKAG
jgi:integration host factor subunit beta